MESCSLCDSNNPFYYKPAECSAAPKNKTDEQTMKETESQMKFQETTEQHLLFSAAKKGNLTWRYLPETLPLPRPHRAISKCKGGSACSVGLIQLSDT